MDLIACNCMDCTLMYLMFTFSVSLHLCLVYFTLKMYVYVRVYEVYKLYKVHVYISERKKERVNMSSNFLIIYMKYRRNTACA